MWGVVIQKGVEVSGLSRAESVMGKHGLCGMGNSAIMIPKTLLGASTKP